MLDNHTNFFVGHWKFLVISLQGESGRKGQIPCPRLHYWHVGSLHPAEVLPTMVLQQQWTRNYSAVQANCQKEKKVCVYIQLFYMFVIYVPVTKEGRAPKHSVENEVMKSNAKSEAHPLLTSTSRIKKVPELPNMWMCICAVKFPPGKKIHIF